MAGLMHNKDRHCIAEEATGHIVVFPGCGVSAGVSLQPEFHCTCCVKLRATLCHPKTCQSLFRTTSSMGAHGPWAPLGAIALCCCCPTASAASNMGGMPDSNADIWDKELPSVILMQDTGLNRKLRGTGPWDLSRPSACVDTAPQHAKRVSTEACN
jgi:hypothetical protein